MRVPRLFALVCALVLEGLFFTALSPLLPGLKGDLHLSSAQAGFLASAYAVGVVIAAVPAAVVSTRLGVKPATVVGLVVLAGMNFAFGVADAYPTLVAAQVAAGVGAGIMWVAVMSWMVGVTPPARRGEVIGAAFGAGAIGEITGPIVGGIAGTAGRAVTFGSIAAVTLVLAALTSRVAAPVRPSPLLGFHIAAASGRVRAAAALSAVPAITLGALLVLGALQLNHLGAGTAAITAVLVVAAAAAVVQGPLVGRWSDRDGRLRPIRFGLLAGVPTLSALAWTHDAVVVGGLLVVGMIMVRFMFAPTVALLSDACETAEVGTVVVFVIVMPVSAAGIAIGSGGGGVLAQTVGFSGAYAVLAAVLLATLIGLRKQADGNRVAAGTASECDPLLQIERRGSLANPQPPSVDLAKER